MFLCNMQDFNPLCMTGRGGSPWGQSLLSQNSPCSLPAQGFVSVAWIKLGADAPDRRLGAKTCGIRTCATPGKLSTARLTAVPVTASMFMLSLIARQEETQAAVSEGLSLAQVSEGTVPSPLSADVS